MRKSHKALLYNFLGFAPVFMLLYLLIKLFTNLTDWWIPGTAFIATTILAPKFQAAKLYGDEKLFVRWLFFKGVKELK